jgi:hypothetical protein
LIILSFVLCAWDIFVMVGAVVGWIYDPEEQDTCIIETDRAAIADRIQHYQQ